MYLKSFRLIAKSLTITGASDKKNVYSLFLNKESAKFHFFKSK